MRARHWAMLGGLVVGLGIGRRLAVRRRRAHGRDLFHAQPPMRYSALTWLSAHPSKPALDLLRRYVAWEPIPMLQRRGTVILQRMGAAMGQGDAA